ncbi:MAG: ABC transporter substrate-binding protein, partial [Candidatus Electrothrix sp. AUS4]|nr:ABC transporter substrate-binding protein [Candidatus Electrothrix sp. AUS4]
MRLRGYVVMTLALFCLFITALWGGAIVHADEHTEPASKQGKKWRIGYLEGNEKDEYADYLRALVKGLIELGWVQSISIPKNPSSLVVWNWISSNIQSDYIEFVDDAYWSGFDDEELRDRNKRAAIERLNTVQDLDLMIAMGTYAGEDLANDLHHTATMVMNASNPIESRIVQDVEFSGRQHIHALVEPNRYKDQLELFHRIFGFRTLGIIYVDSLAGRAFSAIDDAEEVARKSAFSLEPCVIPADTPDMPQRVAECHEILAPKIDAMYMTSHLGIQPKDMQNLITPLLEYHIPTLSQAGDWEVEYGALMSLNRPDSADVGMFQAKVMAQILHGIPPGEISQIFQNPRDESISLNLKVAQL